MSRRKIEDQRRVVVADDGRLTDPLVLADARRVIGAWNERLAQGMPMLFAPTIGAALSVRHHFLWVHCPGCRAVRDVDLRMVNCGRGTSVTCLTSAFACGACKSTGTFPQELLRLSKTGIADHMRKAYGRRAIE